MSIQLTVITVGTLFALILMYDSYLDKKSNRQAYRRMADAYRRQPTNHE